MGHIFWNYCVWAVICYCIKMNQKYYRHIFKYTVGVVLLVPRLAVVRLSGKVLVEREECLNLLLYGCWASSFCLHEAAGLNGSASLNWDWRYVVDGSASTRCTRLSEMISGSDAAQQKPSLADRTTSSDGCVAAAESKGVADHGRPCVRSPDPPPPLTSPNHSDMRFSQIRRESSYPFPPDCVLVYCSHGPRWKVRRMFCTPSPSRNKKAISRLGTPLVARTA